MTLSRREFVASAAVVSAAMTPKERVDRALAGREVDRPPFSYWYHFHLEKLPGERHARATLDFHRKFGTDLVKVMSDFPFPRAAGNWWEVAEHQNPFPEQIRALEIIREELGGKAHFVETIFNPFNQARKLASMEAVQRLKAEKPQALLDALEKIARSEANHARRAVAAGASGIFLAIDNAEPGILTREEYARFSEPFDRMVLEAVRQAPLNILHLHGDKVYLDLFLRGWPGVAINYSPHGTGVGLAEARKQFDGVLLGGIDERRFRTLTREEMAAQCREARQAVGARHILTPGCSVPDETTDEEMLRLPQAIGAVAGAAG